MAVRIESHAEPIPGYRLLERLGGGGFGEVWKAEAPGGLLKAIKFVYGELDAAGGEAQRAEQELKAMRRVQSVRHPYILSLERYDIIDGQLMIVMELADRNLWDRFKECRSQGLPGIPRDELLRYMREAAEALDLMNNTYQLQHLDIKPQNLFLVHNHIKVADFGLVKDLEGMAASVTGGVTPVYAAPETFDGWVSRYSDQYSLAIVYQELLTGQRPFPGNNVRQLILQHLQGTPNLSPLPPDDRPIIGRALAKNPEERHPSCQAMVEALVAVSPSAPPLSASTPDTNLLAAAITEINLPPGGGKSAREPGSRAERPRSGGENGTDVLSNSSAEPAISQRPTCWLGGPGGAPAAAPAPVTPPPSAERLGDGPLFPALVVGIGGLGLAVLQRLRQALEMQFGGPDALPQLRLLSLDTDPASARHARSAVGGELLLARLQRPSHYLKPRDGRPEIDSWLDPKMLYRIPRSQLTGGFRALGRLAFCDNFRAIAQKLRAELEASTDAAAIETAARQTRLGVRRTQPRAYILAGLGGGSGGGMFLDLAYVIRHLLRQLVPGEPDVVGLFLVPPADRSPANPLPLGNAFAALTELGHFAHGGFTARYLVRDGYVQDAGPPLSRWAVLPLPEEHDAPAADEILAQAAEFLARDLWTPLGRAADQARAAITDRGSRPTDRADRPAICQTFGLYKFVYPHRELTRCVAQRLCADLVGRWMSKDATPLREPLTSWLQENWPRDNYGPESFIERLQDDCTHQLGQAPQDFLATLTTDIDGPAAPDQAAVRDALERLETQIGRPGEATLADRPYRFHELLRDAGDRIVAAWGQRLNELIISLIEAPGFRLAGAEEAARSIIAGLDEFLKHQEPLIKELSGRAEAAYERLGQLIVLLQRPPAKGRPHPSAAEVRQLLDGYARYRYQVLVLQQVSRGLVSLRGQVSDQLREFNFCRARLDELRRAFSSDKEPAVVAPDSLAACPGRRLLPQGASTVDEAVERILAEVTAEQLAELDKRVQTMIDRQFTALAHVCLAPANLLRNLAVAMQQEAEGVIRGNLSAANAAELFLEHYPDEDEARDALVAAFEEAAPELAGRATEFCILAVPPGPAGERVSELAKEALPDVRLTVAVGSDDVLLYREAAQLPLAQLPQLGPVGQEAYRQLAAVEHFTPHVRLDIDFQAALKPV